MANLKELLKELDDPNPISVDPDDEELGITSAHIIYKNDHQKEKYEGSTHAQFGNLRVRTAATRLADDPKYAGKKVSRDDLFSDSDRDLNPADQSDVGEYSVSEKVILFMGPWNCRPNLQVKNNMLLSTRGQD